MARDFPVDGWKISTWRCMEPQRMPSPEADQMARKGRTQRPVWLLCLTTAVGLASSSAGLHTRSASS